MASDYNHGHHESVLRSHRWRTAENSAAFLLDHLRRGMSLLDVGCGPGTITIDIARRIAPGRVVGIDPAAEVIELARAEPDAELVDFRVGGIAELPVLGETFDVVFAHQVLQHLEDPVAALRAMASACRPGGVVAAREGDYGAMTFYPGDPELEEWRALYSAVTRGNRTEPDAGRRVLAWARAAGFEEIEATASVWCYSSAEEREWWGSLWAERMVKSNIATQALETGLATHADLERLARAWRRWADDPDGWFAVLNGEILCRIPE